MDPLILNFCTECVVSFMLRPLHLLERIPPYPLNWRLDGPYRKC